MAQLAEDVGRALLRFADAIRSYPPLSDGAPEGSGRLGQTQRRVLELPGLGERDGVSAREVAEVLGLERANAHRTLKSLTTVGLVEQVEGERPHRWRLPLAQEKK